MHNFLILILTVAILVLFQFGNEMGLTSGKNDSKHKIPSQFSMH